MLGRPPPTVLLLVAPPPEYIDQRLQPLVASTNRMLILEHSPFNKTDLLDCQTHKKNYAEHQRSNSSVRYGTAPKQMLNVKKKKKKKKSCAVFKDKTTPSTGDQINPNMKHLFF